VPAPVAAKPPKSEFKPRLPEWSRPVKQKRALLKSNLPRDNGLRRRNKNVFIFGEASMLPSKGLETFISKFSYALKTRAWVQESPGFLVLNRELEKSISR
jgi:hypothetical protein